MNNTTWGEALAWAESQLVGRRNDCLRLMTDNYEQNLLSVYKLFEQPYPDFNKLRVDVLRCLAGEPVAYITKRQDFWRYQFMVNEHVLIPRQDSEMLIEALLELPKPPTNILELGVGSGAIIISYLLENPNCQGFASDISSEALSVAKNNAAKLNCKNLLLACGSWFKPWQTKFDVIVANPPYIAADDTCLKQLSHEPTIALVAKNNGLSDLIEIMQLAPNYLKPGGWLLLEHGFKQNLVQMADPNVWQNAYCRKDLNGHYRITILQNNHKNIY